LYSTDTSPRGCSLRVSRALLGLAIAAFAAVGVRADAVDPTVIIRRVDPKPVVITSPNQTFDLFANTQQNIFAFQNATGMTLTSLTLDLFGQNVSLLFSCGSFAGGDIFANCTSTQGSQDDYLINFSGVGNGFTGIEAATCTIDDKGIGDGLHAPFDNNSDDKLVCTGGIYSLEFDGIPHGAIVRGTGTFETPEPATAVLMLGGLAGLVGLRKRRNS
jgi:PEP-CTERM motif